MRIWLLLGVLLLCLWPLSRLALWAASSCSNGPTVECRFVNHGQVAVFYGDLALSNATPNQIFFSCVDLSNKNRHKTRGVSVERVYFEDAHVSVAMREESGVLRISSWDLPTLKARPSISTPFFEAGRTVVTDNAFVHLPRGRFPGFISEVVELVDPVDLASLDQWKLTGFTPNSIERVEGTNCLVVSGVPQTGGVPLAANKTVAVIRVGQGKLDVVGQLTSSLVERTRADDSGDFFWITLSPDESFLEVRYGLDCSLRNRIDVGQSPGLSTSMPVKYEAGISWVSITGPTRVTECLDLFTGKQLPIPRGMETIARLPEKRIVVADSTRTTVHLIDESSRKTMAELFVQGRILATKFLDNGQRIAIATSEEKVYILAAADGRLLELIDPYRYQALLNTSIAIAFVVWCVSWIRANATVHRHAWLDCMVVSGVAIAYIYVRVRMVGHPSDVVRPIYQLSEGIFASWLLVSGVWLVLGKSRLTLRMLPSIIVPGVIVGLALITVGFGNERIWELALGAGLMSVWLVIALIPLRMFRYRFGETRGKSSSDYPLLAITEAHAPPAAQGSAIPIRDLFLLTSVLAVIFSLGRFTPPTMRFSIDAVVELLILAIAVTLTGIAAIRLGLGQQPLTSRILVAFSALVLGMLFPLVWSASRNGSSVLASPNWHFVYWELRLHVSTALATALCAYAFRTRNWRIFRDCASTAPKQFDTRV